MYPPLCSLPTEVLSGTILPYLSIPELKRLDVALKKEFPCLTSTIWKSFTYDSIENPLLYDDFRWCCDVGVNFARLNLCLSDVYYPHIFSLINHAPMLKTLSIIYNVTDAVLIELALCCPQLESLQIGFGEYSDEGLIAIAEHCHSLQTISWSADRSTDAAVEILCKNCSLLRHIYCGNLTDASLSIIAHTYPHLQSIGTSKCQISDIGLLNFSSHCHELRSATLHKCSNITSSCFAVVWARNPNLTNIVVSNNPDINVDAISVLVKRCCHLTKIKMPWCRKMSDTAVIAIAEHCSQLTVLNLCSCDDLTNDALIALGQHCHELKSIDISWLQNITAVGILALAIGCPLLEEFSAFFANITEAGVVGLAQHCKELRKIDVRHTMASRQASNLMYRLGLHDDREGDTCVRVAVKLCPRLVRWNKKTVIQAPQIKTPKRDMSFVWGFLFCVQGLLLVVCISLVCYNLIVYVFLAWQKKLCAVITC